MWAAAGYLEELANKGEAYTQHYLGMQEALYARDDRRYLYMKSETRADGTPLKLNGMSGSGVWEIPLAAKEKGSTDIEVGRPILRGVTFAQERGQAFFYAHELETIADQVISWLA